MFQARLVSVPLCFWLCLGCLAAQPASIRPIRGTFYRPAPGPLGQVVTIEGVITEEPHDVGQGNSLANLQDESAGVALFAPLQTLPLTGFQRGDQVRATGAIGEFRGMKELQVTQIVKIGSTPPPAPRDVMVSQLLSPRYSGLLVRVAGRLVLPQGQPRIRDRSGEVPVYLVHSFFQNTGFMERLLKGGDAEIVGLARQRSRDGAPSDPGYLLAPRDERDFKFMPQPRRREILLGILATLGIMVYLWIRRRTADRRARELTVLSEGLKASEERFRQMAENIDQVFWIGEVGMTKVFYVSPAFEKIWGRPCQCLQRGAQCFLETVHPEDRQRVTAFLQARDSLPTQEVYRIVRPDGTVRWIQDRAFPVRDACGRIYRAAGVAADITAQQELQDQLHQAQKMEAVGRLAGGVAHDFNNLLMIIVGYIEILRKDSPHDSPQLPMLEEIAKSAAQAAKLVQQLLTFSRRQITRPQVLDLNEVIRNMEKMLCHLVGEDVMLVTRLSPELGPVKMDTQQVQQIIMNLAVNARDAMPMGGSLTIETANVDARVMLAVADTGCGMDPETQRRVFEPFFTTKEVGKGTGLGLATVYGIVKQADGNIELTSAPGAGTAFRIYLPRTAEAAEAPAAERLAPAAALGSGTILVVEDEESVRALVRRILSQNGYQVIEAKDPAAALRIAREHQGPIDLMLTDVVMPQMSGCELARRLTPLRAGMGVLYMSGYTNENIALHGVLDPDVTLLQKPFTHEELLQRVRETLLARQ